MTATDEVIDRPTARVILLGPGDRTLLFRGRDPDAKTGRPFWFPPGGGLEDGEAFEEAARRELFEETGLGDIPIGPCVWLREHTWPWQGRLYRSIERYYLARSSSLEVDTGRFTELELLAIAEHRWWSCAEIAGSDDIFVPRALATLLEPILRGELPDSPVDVGV